ncbi:hypothetical protein BCR43DRAFT_493639 [Syncephalastrum racemosum]|uniref:Uncharacterized protein n=1 Tax=Syncephalastrum racemosum TaxID=13706 RepID=A0A1X2HC81_SYNRA|nr:hypothetical protein BCR43DRAFT_493639 [Syncephalastrum racemosum]
MDEFLEPLFCELLTLYASILGMDLRYFGNETDEIGASARIMLVQNRQSNQLRRRMTRLLQMLHVRPAGGGGATPSNIDALLLAMAEVIERAESCQQARLE